MAGGYKRFDIHWAAESGALLISDKRSYARVMSTHRRLAISLYLRLLSELGRLVTDTLRI